MHVRSRSRILISIVAAATTSLTLAACGSGSGSSEDSYDVLFISGLTGPTGPAQRAVVEGMEAAAEQINSDGGILGDQVKISTCDTKGDPGKAAACAQDAVSDAPDLVYAGGGSSNSLAELPILTRAKILTIEPLLAPGAGDPETYPYNFSTTLAVQDGANAFAEHAKSEAFGRVAVLYSTDAYGAATGEAYAAALEEAGVEITTASYDPTAVDITSILLKLKDTDPDLLFAVGFGAPAGHVLTSMKKLAWDVPLIGDLGVSNTGLPALVSDESVLEGLNVQVFASQAWVEPADRSQAVQDLLSHLGDTENRTQSLANYGYGWDALYLARLGVEEAGTLDAAKVVAAIESLPEQDPSPFVALTQYKYSSTNHLPAGSSSDYSVIPFTELTDGMMGKPE